MLKSRQRFISVAVTRGFILTGMQNTYGHCPIANALKGNGWHSPKVAKNLVKITDPDTGLRYQFTTPTEAADWLRRFDLKGPDDVYPFTMHLDLKMATILPSQRGRITVPGKSKPKSKPTNNRPDEMVWW